MVISKSRYLKYCQCPKLVWLEKNLKIDDNTNKFVYLYNPAKEVEELSWKLFSGKSAVICDGGGKYHFEKMAKYTKELIDCGEKVIYKATFLADKSYFVIDIIKKVKNGYMVYLVKPSKNLRQNFLQEMAYIGYALKMAGVSVYRYIIVTINKDFVKNGNINPKQFFKLNYVGTKIKQFEGDIEQNILGYENIIKSEVEPEDKFCPQCISRNCIYLNHCSSHLPVPSVFDLHACTNKGELYSKKIWSFEDILNSGTPLNDIQKRQIDFNINDKKIYVDKENLNRFLDKLSYPLYFLDFETTFQEVPAFDGIKPFEVIPFQYSLHYINKKGGKVYHKEFLSDENSNPKVELSKHLFEDLKGCKTILAYNIALEKNVVLSLGREFKEYKDFSEKLSKNFVDLIEPFDNGYVYDKKMGGSFSLKSVLPALFPDDPALNYSNLEDIHNGLDARMIFPSLKFMSESDRKRERENLLRYCYLDTFAMVKIVEKLTKLGK